MRPVAGGILAVLLFLLGLFSLYRRTEVEALAENGTRSMGVVTELERRRERYGESFYLNYTFPVAHGSVKGGVKVDEATFGRVATGAPLEVRYDPRDPGPRHVVLPYGLDDVRGWPQYVLAFGFAAGIGWWSWRGRRRARTRTSGPPPAP